jgi:hypothetical protein
MVEPGYGFLRSVQALQLSKRSTLLFLLLVKVQRSEATGVVPESPVSGTQSGFRPSQRGRQIRSELNYGGILHPPDNPPSNPPGSPPGDPPVVPEPGTLSLVLIGLGSSAFARRRHKRK